jgi:hypothetical protein
MPSRISALSASRVTISAMISLGSRNGASSSLPEQEQTRLYESYWSKIESLFRESEKLFDAFARDYVALKNRAKKQDKASEIYRAFRRHFEDLAPHSDR